VSESLDHFVRDALREHDGLEQSVAAEAGVSTGAAEMGVLPGHKVEGFIARGGMGAVYRATQVALDREVAVKVMTDLAGSPEMAERFQREALVLGRLEHPNIVPIHELGADEEGQLYYTMKLVKGRTLQHILNDLRISDAKALSDYPLASLLTIFRKVCDAMAFAHSQGVIHRDLKPENIMVGEFGEVLVMDWGLAKFTNEECRMKNGGTESESSFDIPHSSFSGTLAGSVMGTPQYMSPEQAMGQIEELDQRSDIFSLGGILYAILTLRPPVEGQTLEEVLRKVSSAEITSPSGYTAATNSKGKQRKKEKVLDANAIRPLPHVPSGRAPAALSAVAMKALQLEKERRYQRVEQLSADIEAYQGGFATTAEQAGALKQIKLLMMRHKAVTASLLAMLVLSVGFVLRVIASERKANENAMLAMANEALANQRAEETRSALAESQLAVAQAAWKAHDQAAMGASLSEVNEAFRDQRWRYLNDKLEGSIGRLMLRDIGGVTDVKAIPGSRGVFLVAGDAGVVVKLRAPKLESSGRIDLGLKGRAHLAVSDDGRLMAAAVHQADHIPVYRMSDGKLDTKILFKLEHSAKLTFSPDNTKLLVVSRDYTRDLSLATVHLLEVATSKVLWQKKAYWKNGVFLPDGRTMLYASDRARDYGLVDVMTGEQTNVTKEYVVCMDINHDGSEVALGTHTGEVLVVDAATAREKSRVKVHQGRIGEIAWTPSGHLLSVGTMTGTGNLVIAMKLTDMENNANLGTYFGKNLSEAWGDFAYEPKSGYVLFPPAANGTAVTLWQVPVDMECGSYSATSEQGWDTAFVSDTQLLTRERFSLQLVDVTTPSASRHGLWKPLENGRVVVATHVPKGLVALGMGVGDIAPDVQLLQSDGNDPTLKLLRAQALPESVMGLDFDATGDRLLITTRRHKLHWMETRAGGKLELLPASATIAAFAGEGFIAVRRLSFVSSKAEYELAVYPSLKAKPSQAIRFPFTVDAMAVSRDRTLVAIGGDDMMVRVFEVATLRELHRFRAHDSRVTAVAFHPKLPQLATGSADRTVKLWDYAKAEIKHQFVGLPGAPLAMDFSPNGRLLSVEGEGRSAKLFDLESGFTAKNSVVQPVDPPDALLANQQQLFQAGDWQSLIKQLEPLKLDPFIDHAMRYAAVLAYADKGRYAGYRKELLAHFGKTADTRQKRVLVKICLLHTADDLTADEIALLRRMADEQWSEPSVKSPHTILSKVIADMRLGALEVAANAISEQIHQASKDVSAQRALSYVRVIAAKQLGETARTMESIGYARQLESRPRSPSEIRVWHDDLIVKILQREAGM